jgi:hypothetical protein
MANDDEGQLKQTVVNRMPRLSDLERLKPLMNQLGLAKEEMVERLVSILLIHLVMDRSITSVLTVQLIKDNAAAFDEVESELARSNLASRIRLAKASGVISDACASDMLDVNNIRNLFSHYNPKLQGGLAAVNEIASEEAFEKCIVKAVGTLGQMGKVLGFPLQKS